MGHNGAGKTTLINILTGLDNDFEGQVKFELTSLNQSQNISLDWSGVKIGLATH